MKQKSVKAEERSLNRVMIVLVALLGSLPLMGAEHGGAGRERGSERGGSSFHGGFEGGRSFHGSIRHDSVPHFETRREPEHREVHREFSPRHDVFVHRDVDVDIHHPHHWDGFAFGRRIGALPFGYLSLRIGGAPYYYADGLYYQPYQGGYQEVYPPVGAALPSPPDGAIAIPANGYTYYYAAGGFYVQQPDGRFVSVQPPIGIIVPELPPGAVQVSLRGMLAYQFNGIYYQPVFVNGVTQYQIVAP
jgi:Family of unknown function (DUF6515)